MLSKITASVAVGVLAFIAGAPSIAQPPAPPQDCPAVRDVLVTNGKIHTMTTFRGTVESVRIIDDRASNDCPTPLKASGTDETLVGRIRPDDSQDAIERQSEDRTHKDTPAPARGTQATSSGKGRARRWRVPADLVGE